MVGRIAIIAVTLIFAIMVEGFPGEPTKEAMKRPVMGQMPLVTCAGYNVKISNATWQAVVNCRPSSIAASNGSESYKPIFHIIPKEERSCYIVCTVQATGIINEAGKIVREKVKNFVEDAIPIPSSKTIEIMSAINTCADDHEASFVWKKGDCSTYQEFIDCTFQKIFKACDFPIPDSSGEASNSAE